ncbi:MAG: ribose-phosphate pyrophosphokinase [Candidatus Aenigmarchaeota archaeon]|nr:ribose-phosphate pyrophosphokinase [Candidatus Aenigmarchaeota archaeon]
MQCEKSAIAIPVYGGKKRPFFGDMVFRYLTEHHEGSFEPIEMEIRDYADGTQEAMTEGHVRGMDVYVMHPLVARGDPAEHTMVAAQISDNLHRSDSCAVIVFDLYNPWNSFDKRKGKQPLTARTVADKYAAAHVDRVFAIDPHSDMLGLAYGPGCPLEPLSMQRPLAKYFMERHTLSDVTVCSPDIGGYNRAEVFADLLNVPLVGLRKRRSMDKADETKVIEIVGDRKFVCGRTILFRDDVLRTAGSLEAAHKAMMEMGARDSYMMVTHLDPCGPATERIRKSGIKVTGTNTVHLELPPEDAALFDVMDVSPIVGEVVYKRANHESIGQFFKSFPGPKNSKP